MNKLIYYIIIFLSFCKSVDIKGIKQNASPKGKLIFGYIESQNILLKSNSKNFRDMLKFEFINSGYSVVSGNIKKPIAEDNNHTEINFTGDFKEKNIYRIFPNYLNEFAGEHRQRSFNENEGKIMSENEIHEISKQEKFDYYFQGSISNSGDMKNLNNNESAVIFLDIFNENGEREGMIHLLLDDKTLYETKLMKNACAQIVSIFNNEIINSPGENRK